MPAFGETLAGTNEGVMTNVCSLANARCRLAKTTHEPAVLLPVYSTVLRSVKPKAHHHISTTLVSALTLSLTQDRTRTHLR